VEEALEQGFHRVVHFTLLFTIPLLHHAQYISAPQGVL
jgi:hypothetical protein